MQEGSGSVALLFAFARGMRLKDEILMRRRVSGLSKSSLLRFVAEVRRVARLPKPVNVLLTGDEELRRLNREFRGKDKSTDVLSFPPAKVAGELFAGDLAISVPTAARNAKPLGHSTAAEVKILVLHGVLHLAGYDHEKDDGRMARKEVQLRRKLELPVGLIERSGTTRRKPGSRRAATT